MGGYMVMAASRGAWVPGVQHDGHDLWSVSASSGLHPISDLSSKIDARPFHVRRGKHAAIPRRRIDLEGGHTLRAGSYSGPAVVARSRVGPSIKFGQIYKSVTGYR